MTVHALTSYFCMIAPADYPRSDAELGAAFEQFLANTNRLNDWMRRETGYEFADPVIRWWRSDKTHIELASVAGDPHVDVNDCGDGWVGMHETAVSRELRFKVYGPDWRLHTEIPGTKTSRIGALLLGGGGFAGGRFVQDFDKGENYGQFMLGGWELHAEAWGHGEPCCIVWKGERWCMRSLLNEGLSWGHEYGHGWGLGDIHAPVVLWMGTPLSDLHKANFILRNEGFIQPVSAPLPPLPPVEPPTDPIPPEPLEPVVVVGTKFTPTPPLHLNRAGQSRRMRLRAHYSDGLAGDVTETAEWISLDRSVVRANDGGRIIAVGPGMTEVWASFDGHDAHFAVQVRR